MKEHFQDYGVRRWAGDDLIELQKEPMEAIQKLVEPYAPCIIQGCEVNATEKRITPGMVALWELDENKQKKGVKIARFEGCVTQSFPVYLTLKRTTEERVYVDGKNKPVAYDYTAQNTTVENDVKDMFPLKITAAGGPRLAESLTVNFTAATERENIQPNETLGTAFGKIRKWFSDLKALAFKDKVAKSDFDDDLTTAFNNKVDKDGKKVLSTNDFTNEAKKKLDSLEIGLDGFSIYRIGYSLSGSTLSDFSISAYFPPTVLNGRTLQVGDLFIEASETSYLYRITAINTNTWSATRLISLRGAKGAPGDAGAPGAEGLGIWRSSTATSSTTTSITLSTITIPAERSVKVGDLIIANSTYSYLYRVTAVSSTTATVTYLTSLRGAQGAAGTNATTTAVATTSANGLMSAADKTKLEGIAEGANNYTHPTTAGNKHIPNYGSSGQYLKYSAQGTATWASPASNVATTSAAGFMSAADKTNLNKLYGWRIIGIYCFTSTDVQYGWGPAISVEKITDGGDVGFKITLSGNEFLESDNHQPFLFGAKGHTGEASTLNVSGRGSFNVFHRKVSDGKAEYANGLRMIIFRLNVQIMYLCKKNHYEAHRTITGATGTFGVV